MSDVATAVQLPMSNTLHYGVVAAGGVSKTSTTTLKRKTPSELRGKLLKQKNSLELSDESLSFTSLMRNADGAVSETKKSDSSKAARFTRMDAHYPERIPVKCVGSINNSSLASDSNAKIEVQNSRLKGAVGSEGGTRHFNNSSGKCPSNTFKSVQERSLGSGKSHDSSSVDMGKALKGLVSCEYRAAPAPLSEPLHREGNLVPQSLSEIHIPGQKIPLDLTLKTSMHVLSSSSVNWFHRLVNCATSNSMCLFLLEGNQGKSVTSAHPTCTSRITTHGGFHSWVHPQSSLPHVAISALTSAAGGQLDFVSKRQQAWEDSFRSLYFMLRKKHCELFYVCTVQFVVMFTGSGGSNKTKHSCHAYVSQSTRNLRSLLKEYDISFSVPLCVSKVEEVSAEDLVELSAIEKNNLGQTRAMGSMRGVDNTPQSLLKFSGKNVHALYDFLLNYRSFYTPLTGNDVPFCIHLFLLKMLRPLPQRCKQVRRVDHMPSQLKESNVDSEPSRSSSTGICYSVEIKDAYLPPWVISGVSNAMRCNGDDFQASIVTESTSIGLNAGLDTVTNQSSQQAETDIPLEENDIFFGIPNSTLSLQRHSAFLKGLKYSD